jgi:hypothetical protein
MTNKQNNPLPDWAVDMAKVPYNPMQERAAFNFSTGGPCSSLPKVSRAGNSAVDPPAPSAPSSGWQAERELGPQPGIDLIDRMVTAADQRERQQTQGPDLMQAAMMMMQLQSQQIAALAALVLHNDKPKRKRSPKQLLNE